MIKLPGDHIAVIGRTRMGKTWLMRYILSVTDSFILIDPDDEYRDLASQHFDELPWEEVRAGILYAAADGEVIRAVIVTGNVDDFNEAALLAYELGNMMFASDEAHQFITSHTIPKHFKLLARKGAKKGVQCVMVSQRHTELNTNYFSQVNLIISFQQLLHKDIKYLQEYIDCRNLSDVLKKLDKGQYIVVENGQMQELLL